MGRMSDEQIEQAEIDRVYVDAVADVRRAVEFGLGIDEAIRLAVSGLGLSQITRLDREAREYYADRQEAAIREEEERDEAENNGQFGVGA